VSPPTPRADQRRFPPTEWSRILDAAADDAAGRAAALDALLRRYWKPLYCYVRALRPLAPADAEDLTQGFFSMLLTRVDFATLSPERGSFRGFLKTALRRFVISEERKQQVRAAERTLPFADAEALRPAEAPSPDEAFDRAWMRTVIDEMLARLRDELHAAGKDVYYDVFRQYCLEPGESLSYDEVARAHGLAADDVRNYLRVVRQRGRAIVRELVAEYLAPGESVDDELAFVLSR
jgi:RNA polymerase sigma-70 factor (ECF subfamily)